MGLGLRATAQSGLSRGLALWEARCWLAPQRNYCPSGLPSPAGWSWIRWSNESVGLSWVARSWHTCTSLEWTGEQEHVQNWVPYFLYKSLMSSQEKSFHSHTLPLETHPHSAGWLQPHAHILDPRDKPATGVKSQTPNTIRLVLSSNRESTQFNTWTGHLL